MRVWRPRPDPALTDPRQSGLRAHRHPPNRLHAWLFLQHQVWVDYWGNEHEIESMNRGYIANVVGFCRRQADRIRFLVTLELLEQLVLGLPVPAPSLVELLESACDEAATDLDLLDETALLRALHRRLGERC